MCETFMLEIRERQDISYFSAPPKLFNAYEKENMFTSVSKSISRMGRRALYMATSWSESMAMAPL